MVSAPSSAPALYVLTGEAAFVEKGTGQPPSRYLSLDAAKQPILPQVKAKTIILLAPARIPLIGFLLCILFLALNFWLSFS